MTATMTITPAPIRKRLEVRASLERTFEVFTRCMNLWWPRDHSIVQAVHGTPQADVRLEPRPGGRWYEIGENGAECDWGDVAEWDAPNRVLLIWRLGADFVYDPNLRTEVEVRFTSGSDGVTVVEFEHRGLEAFGAAVGEVGAGMDAGWSLILGRFVAEATA